MQPDVLGAPYEQQTINLGSDDEGPVVATLVRRRADSVTRRAVLYVHGFVDYFFQTHLAEFYVARGWDFYALDLRKYGRSLLAHQTPNFCRSLDEYFPELDAAAQIIRADHDVLLVNAHSTGCLTTALWANARRDAGIINGLFLNSPFFDLNISRLLRPVAAAACRIGRIWPYWIVPTNSTPVYGESLHADYRGEWRYELAWKPIGGFPVRAGWLNAIRVGQRRLHEGLAIPVPILVATSTASWRSRSCDERAMRADVVLDVAHMARWAPALGRHVTLVQFEGGMHDLTLSAEPVRTAVFNELARWIEAYVVGAPLLETAATSPDATPAGAG